MPEEESNEEFLKRMAGTVTGTGVEIGGGYATDLATAGLLNPATIAATGGWSIAGYAATNFFSGAATNWAAQKLRGEEDISWGELISSGLIDIIPFFGQKLKGAKGVANVALQSGARTVAQRQGEEALDDQRWLTPRETLEAAALGGAFGAGFKGAGEGINILKGKYRKYDLEEARELFENPSVIQALIEEGRIHTVPREARYMAAQKITRQIDENPLGSYKGKDYYESTVDPDFKPNHLERARKGPGGYEELANPDADPATFEHVRTGEYTGSKPYMSDFFEEWTPLKTESVKKDKAGNLIIKEEGFRIHHDNPLKPSYEIKRGLNKVGLDALEEDFAEEAIAFGNLVENFDVIPHDIHKSSYSKTVHKAVERRTGGGSLESLIERFKEEGKLPDKPWHEMELWERKPVIDELKAGILEGRQLLTDFYNVVAALNPNNDATYRTMMNAVDKLDSADLEALAYSMVGKTEMSEWTLDWLETVLGEGELVMKTFRGKNKLTWVSETNRQLDVFGYLIEKYGNSDIGKDMESIYKYALKEEKGMEMLVDRVFNNFTWNQIDKKYKYWDPDMEQLQLAVESVTPKLKSVIRDVREMTVQEIEARINAGWNVKGLTN